MASLTLMFTGHSNTNGTSYSTQSYTPRLGDVLVVNSSASSGTPPQPTVTGGGMTWTLVTSVGWETSSTSKVWMFVADAGTPSADTIDIDYGGGNTQTRAQWTVARPSDCDLAALFPDTDAVGTASGQSTVTGALAGFGAGDVTIGFALTNSGSVDVDPEGGWNKLGQVQSTEGYTLAVGWSTGQDATPSFSRSSGTGRLAGVFAILADGTDNPSAGFSGAVDSAEVQATGDRTVVLIGSEWSATPDIDPDLLDNVVLEVVGDNARDLGVMSASVQLVAGVAELTLIHGAYAYLGDDVEVTVPAALLVNGAEESEVATGLAATNSADTAPTKCGAWHSNQEFGPGGGQAISANTTFYLKTIGGEPIVSISAFCRVTSAADWTTQETVEKTPTLQTRLWPANTLGLPRKGRMYGVTFGPGDFTIEGKAELWYVITDAAGAVHNTQTDPAAETTGIRRFYIHDGTDGRVLGKHAAVRIDGTATGTDALYDTEAEAVTALGNPANCYGPATLGDLLDVALAIQQAKYDAAGEDPEYLCADGGTIHLGAGDYTTPEWASAADDLYTFFAPLTIKGHADVGGSGPVRFTNRAGATGNAYGWRTSLLRFEDVEFAGGAVDKIVPCGNGQGNTDASGWNHTTNEPLARGCAYYVLEHRCEKSARDKADVFQVYGDGAAGQLVVSERYVHDVQTAVNEAPCCVLGLKAESIGKDVLKGKIPYAERYTQDRRSVQLADVAAGTWNSATNELTFESEEFAALTFRAGDDNVRFSDAATSTRSWASPWWAMPPSRSPWAPPTPTARADRTRPRMRTTSTAASTSGPTPSPTGTGTRDR